MERPSVTTMSGAGPPSTLATATAVGPNPALRRSLEEGDHTPPATAPTRTETSFDPWLATTRSGMRSPLTSATVMLAGSSPTGKARGAPNYAVAESGIDHHGVAAAVDKDQVGYPRPCEVGRRDRARVLQRLQADRKRYRGPCADPDRSPAEPLCREHEYRLSIRARPYTVR